MLLWYAGPKAHPRVSTMCAVVKGNNIIQVLGILGFAPVLGILDLGPTLNSRPCVLLWKGLALGPSISTQFKGHLEVTII